MSLGKKVLDRVSGVHYVSAGYLIGFGWSLLYSRFAFSPAMELSKLGLDHNSLGYLCIVCGILMLGLKDMRWLYAMCLAYTPYFVASWLFFVNYHIGMTAISSTFIQASLFLIVSLEGQIRRGEKHG